LFSQVCEDTRHDTLFEIRAQMETYYGSFEWIDCVISDEYEDKIWSKKETRGYLDLFKTNMVESISTEGKEITVSKDDSTGVPTASPKPSPVAPTGSPVLSPSGEADVTIIIAAAQSSIVAATSAASVLSPLLTVYFGVALALLMA